MRCHELEAEIEVLKQRLKKRMGGGPSRQRISKKLKAKRNAALVDQAVNYRKPWTGPELEIVSKVDLTIREAAVILGRSYDAVRHMRRKLANEEDGRMVDLRDGPTPPTAVS